MMIMTLQDRMACTRTSEHTQPYSRAPPFVVNSSRMRAETIRIGQIEHSGLLPTEVVWLGSTLLIVGTCLLEETTFLDAPRQDVHGGCCLAPSVGALQTLVI